jgi:uncharacterized protein YjbJ (UPF0337 family)
VGLFDRWKGRAKQAAGDLTGSAATRREGKQEERSAEAKEEAARAEEHAEQKRREASEVSPHAEGSERGGRP